MAKRDGERTMETKERRERMEDRKEGASVE